MDKLFQTFWEVKGFNRFFDVPKIRNPNEQFKLLTEVFEDMAISGGKREGLVMPISSLFMSINDASNKVKQNAISVSHADFIAAGMIKALVDVGNKCIDDKAFRKFDQNEFCPYYCAHILSAVVADTNYQQRAIEDGAFELFVRFFKGGLSWCEARTSAKGLSTLAATEYIKLFTPDIITQAIEHFVNSWTTTYTHFIQKPLKRKNPWCDIMTRGEAGTDEETFLAFYWMENLRSWSGMIVHHYFKHKPLEGTKIFIENPQLFDALPISFYYENQLTDAPDEFGSVPLWAAMTLESMATIELGRKTILDNTNVVRVIQEIGRGALNHWDRLLNVILSLISHEDSRARAIEYFGEIICDVRNVTFGTKGKIRPLGEMLAEKVLEPYFEVQDYQAKSTQEQDCINELLRNMAKQQSLQSSAGKARVDKAKKLKDEGNKSIASDIKQAIQCYEEAIHLCPETQKEVIVALYSNLAEAYSRLKQSATDAKSKEECNWKIIKWSTRAQCIELHHPKTLWKRASAYCELGLARAALEDMNNFSMTTKTLTEEMKSLIADCSALCHPYSYLHAKFGPIEREDGGHDDDDDESYTINNKVGRERKKVRQALFGVISHVERLNSKIYPLKMVNRK